MTPDGAITDWGDPSLQYGGAGFEAAAQLLARFSLRERRLPQSGRTARSPQRAAGRSGPKAVVAVLRFLPRINVQLTDSRSGRVIRRHLRRRRFGVAKNRIAQGVLALPASGEDYLRGASQTVRRKVRRATAAGINCSRIELAAEREQLLEKLTPEIEGMAEWVQTLPNRWSDWWLVARDQTGEPIAFAIVVVDREWAMLELMKSTDHDARYLLHTELVAALAERKLRYLFVDSPSALRMDPNLRQFQRILGYGIAHLALR